MTNYQQIAAAVYQRCNHFDPYLPPLSADLARAWGSLFAKHQLPEADALAGVDAVYDEHGSGYRPLPADIIAAARTIRQDRRMREPLEAAPTINEADPRLRAAVRELAAAIPDDEQRFRLPTHDGPRWIPCPWPPCRAPAGRRCFNTATKRPLDAGYHPARIEAAAQARDHEISAAITDRLCRCGREILDTDDTCDRCQPVIDGPQRPDSDRDTG
jgi:hypothetical protein